MHRKTLIFGLGALFALFVATSTMANPVNAHADYGPKPTTTVTLVGMRSVELYYVAPLAQTGDGPWSIATSADDFYGGETLTPIDDQFLAYSDPDGFFYTTRRYSECHGYATVKWSFYPPDPFKVLIFIPENNVFIVTPVIERTTFDSFVSLHLDGEIYLELTPGDKVVVPESAIYHTYRVLPPFFSLLGRIAVTLILELGLALVFRYRSKKQLGAIALTNIVTQLAINIVLIVTYIYLGGGLTYWLEFAVCELFVFIGEAIFYHWYFTKKAQEDPQNYFPDNAIVYAFLANLLSMGFGILFSLVQNFSIL